MNDLDLVVVEMMSLYGTSDAGIITTTGVYDPDTRENVLTDIETPVKVIVLDLTLQSNGLATSKDTLIQAGDKQIFVQPANKNDPEVVMPAVEPNKTRVRVGTKVFKVITMKEINTTLNNSVLLDLYVRE